MRYLPITILLFFAVVGTEAAKPVERFPKTYIQSAFFTGPSSSNYATFEDKKLRAEYISRYFDGAEVLNCDVDTSAGLSDVRQLARAFREVSMKNGRRFDGFWSFPRLPGFFRDSDRDRMPESWRAFSLKSDGSLWARRPPVAAETESLISVHGELLDITNWVAVSKLMSDMAKVFDQDGPTTRCIGPIYGYIVLNEWSLSDLYTSVWSEQGYNHDVDKPDRVIRLRKQSHAALFTDNDPYYSMLQPPKRAVPLFSEGAAKSFIAYCEKKGRKYDALPADRLEFNDDDSSLAPLPQWVKFVPLSEPQYWKDWEDWVYDCWSSFAEKSARAFGEAQKGNPDFKGVLYFTLPGWYSLRQSSREPVTYRYIDDGGTTRTSTEVLARYPEYNRLNSVSFGTDMDRLMKSPCFSGMIHETTNAVALSIPGNLFDVQADIFADNTDRHRHYFLAQGMLMKKVCHRNGKLFGAFARAQSFRPSKPFDCLTTEGFKRGFERTVVPLGPDVDIVATIGPWFMNVKLANPNVYDAMGGGSGELQGIFQQMMTNFRRNYEEAGHKPVARRR